MQHAREENRHEHGASLTDIGPRRHRARLFWHRVAVERPPIVRDFSVRRLVEYEDYIQRLMRDAGVPSAEPFGIVEILPDGSGVAWGEVVGLVARHIADVVVTGAAGQVVIARTSSGVDALSSFLQISCPNLKLALK